MAVKDHDAYIAAAPEYAQPILEKLRSIVHATVPGVEESIKWSAPAFDSNGVLVCVCAFKAHVALRLWRGSELSDPKGLLERVGKSEMGSISFERVGDIPIGALKALLKEAAQLNKAGKKPPRKAPGKALKDAAPKKAPADFVAALKRVKGAKANFDGFAAGYQADYISWITDAKREATREKRIAQAAEWIGEGKTRNWKYR